MKNKILFVVSLLFGLLFINGGLDKFFHYMPPPKDMPPSVMEVMGAMMKITWLMPLVAVAELVGGILFIPAKTRALGAIIIFPVLLGIVVLTIVSMPSGLPMAVVLTLVELWVIFENRKKYMPMIS